MCPKCNPSWGLNVAHHYHVKKSMSHQSFQVFSVLVLGSVLNVIRFICDSYMIHEETMCHAVFLCQGSRVNGTRVIQISCLARSVTPLIWSISFICRTNTTQGDMSRSNSRSKGQTPFQISNGYFKRVVKTGRANSVAPRLFVLEWFASYVTQM